MTARRRSPLLSVPDAIATVLDSLAPLPEIELAIAEARGMVLAADVIARDDVPFDDNSAMDGFAFRSEDVERASSSEPVRLRVLPGTVAAGPARELAVAAGAAARIMTGAPIPAGADAVAPFETVELDGEQLVVREPFPEGANVRRAGEDIAAGSVSLPRGAHLSPAALGVAVLSGVRTLRVHRRPVVAFLSSGDELIGPGAPMKRGLVRDSNSVVLAALAHGLGCDVMELGVAPDDEEAIRERIHLARRADAIVTTGGVSVGDRDYTRKVLDESGLKVKFHGVDVKPGKPVLFGLLGKSLVFGLPGNPVSAHVAFELFARPALLALMGHSRIFRAAVRARLEHEIRRSPGRPEYLRVALCGASGEWTARLTRERQGSGVATSVLGADGLLHVPGDTVFLPAGEACLVQLMDEPRAENFAFSGEPARASQDAP